MKRNSEIFLPIWIMMNYSQKHLTHNLFDHFDAKINLAFVFETHNSLGIQIMLREKWAAYKHKTCPQKFKWVKVQDHLYLRIVMTGMTCLLEACQRRDNSDNNQVASKWNSSSMVKVHGTRTNAYIIMWAILIDCVTVFYYWIYRSSYHIYILYCNIAKTMRGKLHKVHHFLSLHRRWITIDKETQTTSVRQRLSCKWCPLRII